MRTVPVRCPPWSEVVVRRYVVIGALVLVVLGLPVRNPIVSALSGEPVPGVGLEHSLGYLLLAPFYGIFDYLTVLTVPQHVVVLVSLFLGFGAWRVFRGRTRRSVPVRILIEVAALVGFIVGLAAFYATGVLAYRPMARLVVDDPDVVVVDFHSHTNASHDGRWDFDTDRNRNWHRGAGMQVAFVADHDSVAPVLRAMQSNPARAGDDTVLLPAREVVYARQHVVALGTVDPRTGEGGWLPDPQAPPGPHAVEGIEGALVDDDGLPARWCEGWPVLIQTIPNDLGRVPVPGCSGTGAGVEAIELLDGDPRGLAQSDRERARILAIADSLDLALVSSSNLHGWGATAVSWNLMMIPGWRDMAPEEVGARIQEKLREERRDAVEVVAYRRPVAGPGTWAAVGSTALVPVHFAVLRSRAERLSWLLWIGLAVAVVRMGARRRAAAGSAAVG